jgi:hypothetical protein
LNVPLQFFLVQFYESYLAVVLCFRRFIGVYSPEERRKRIDRYLEKRRRRVWTKKVDYDVRKNFADSRLRVKGRFVKKEDEEVLIQMLSLA